MEGLGKLKKKSNNLIGNRTRGLAACSKEPHPATLLRAHTFILVSLINILRLL
jgi:hypothetical protein